jgi:hypothetical protein
MSHQKNSLCKDCKHKFRRVFIPLRPEEYADDDGNHVTVGEDNIFIVNTCLISNMDVDGESTVECDHYEQKQENGRFPFFKHLK